MRYANEEAAVKWANAHGLVIVGNYITSHGPLTLRQCGVVDMLRKLGYTLK